MWIKYEENNSLVECFSLNETIRLFHCWWMGQRYSSKNLQYLQSTTHNKKYVVSVLTIIITLYCLDKNIWTFLDVITYFLDFCEHLARLFQLKPVFTSLGTVTLILFFILETDSSCSLCEPKVHDRSLSIYVSAIITPQMLSEVSQSLLGRFCSLVDE